jgi:hypothetical protein
MPHGFWASSQTKNHLKAGFFSSSLELAREIILKSLEISLAVKSQKNIDN